jgi:hypothetical protein
MRATLCPASLRGVSEQALPSTPWQPGNSTEAQLLAAIERDDRQEFFRILARVPLFLPQTVRDPAAADGAAPAAENFVTYATNEATYLLAFTSVESLQSSVGHIANGYVQSDYAELRQNLTGQDIQVAFNLGTPIDAWLDVESVAKAADGDLTVPTGPEMAVLMEVEDPANAEAIEEAVEQELVNYVDEYITGLITQNVLVVGDGTGWRIRPVDGQPTVEAYSKPEFVPPGTPTVEVPFMALVRNWPPGAEQLSVNPDTPLAFAMPGEVIEAFVGVAAPMPPATDPDP